MILTTKHGTPWSSTRDDVTLAKSIWYSFTIPSLPKVWYEYLKQVRVTTGLSPWQVVILGLKALQHVGTHDGPTALTLVEEVKRDYPAP